MFEYLFPFYTYLFIIFNISPDKKAKEEMQTQSSDPSSEK